MIVVSQRLSGKAYVIVACAMVLSCFLLAETPCGKAQEPTSRNEVWPEVDVYITLKPKLRMFLLGTASRSVEDGEVLIGKAYEAQFGVHLDYIPTKHFILRNGYRFGTSIGQDDHFKEHRVLSEQTFRQSIGRGLLVSDRNREDFRIINGDFSFRYRNRITSEREFDLKHRSVTPYVSAEVYFDTRHNVWNKFRFTAGAQIGLRRGAFNQVLPRHQRLLDIYYTRQHDSRSSTSKINALGVALSFYF
jgi:uncharacterized protein DUF2490